MQDLYTLLSKHRSDLRASNRKNKEDDTADPLEWLIKMGGSILAKSVGTTLKNFDTADWYQAQKDYFIYTQVMREQEEARLEKEFYEKAKVILDKLIDDFNNQPTT